MYIRMHHLLSYWTFGRCDYQLVFNINPKTLDKGERLEYGESMMTHAMVLTAVSEKQVNYTNNTRVYTVYVSLHDVAWFLFDDFVVLHFKMCYRDFNN